MKRLYVFGTRGFPNVQGGVEKHCEQLIPNCQINIILPYLGEKLFFQ